MRMENLFEEIFERTEQEVDALPTALLLDLIGDDSCIRTGSQRYCDHLAIFVPNDADFLVPANYIASSSKREAIVLQYGYMNDYMAYNAMPTEWTICFKLSSTAKVKTMQLIGKDTLRYNAWRYATTILDEVRREHSIIALALADKNVRVGLFHLALQHYNPELAYRSRYVGDVPESMRPLLTCTMEQIDETFV
jgi:hypothetical protein